MIDFYETPYKNVHINVAAPIITVRCSGGFDSALLLYMVAKACKQLNPTAVIQPITVVRTNEEQHPEWHRVDNLPIVDDIIAWVREQFPDVNIKDKQWLDALKWWENGNVSYTDAQKKLVIQNIDVNALLESQYVTRVLDYNGVTKNPPVPMSINNMHEHRVRKRDFDDGISPAVDENSATVVHEMGGTNTNFVEPFRNTDKRVTMYLAKKLGILETLDSITRSCEGGREETENWTKICSTCWWCQERAWAMAEVNA